MITLTATITLEDGTELKLNKKNIISIDQNIIDRSDIKKPSWGIVSNSGIIEFADNDKDLQVEDLVEALKLTNKAKVNISLENTIAKSKNTVGEFWASSWNYDGIAHIVTLTIKDDLEEWQEIQTEILPVQVALTGTEIYEYLKSITPNKWVFADLDEVTQNTLDKYYIYFPYLNRASLWRQWEKLCEACGLNIFKNKENKVVVSYHFRSF
jgi:hypothetical protein